jgi:hypothetical protein
MIATDTMEAIINVVGEGSGCGSGVLVGCSEGEGDGVGVGMLDGDGVGLVVGEDVEFWTKNRTGEEDALKCILPPPDSSDRLAVITILW